MVLEEEETKEQYMSFAMAAIQRYDTLHGWHKSAQR